MAPASDSMAAAFQEGVSQEDPTSESEIARGLSGTEMLPNLSNPRHHFHCILLAREINSSPNSKIGELTSIS